jgi:hypothetical protein
MNVYTTAPGQDWNRTVGMCGNNNGNPSDDTAGYVIWKAQNLLPTQRMNGRPDLWSWFPTPGALPTSTAGAQQCDTVDTPVVPVLVGPRES